MSNHTQVTITVDFKEINRIAAMSSATLLGHLLPSGKRIGAEWVALNPKRDDRSLGSFRVNMNTGKWADFAIGVKGGDFISLAAYLLDLRQFEAAKRITAILGVKSHELSR